MNETQTGIPIADCETCGRRHPVTRTHCVVCGAASLFPHAVHDRKGENVSEMDRAMQRMKDLGVTITVTPGAGTKEEQAGRPSGVIAEYARKHGIYGTKERR